MLWTVACQALLSMGFPSKNTGVGCHFLLQGFFPTQGSNPPLLHWQTDSLPPPRKNNGPSVKSTLLVCLTTASLGLAVKNPLQCRRPGFDPWVGKNPWRREMLPTPVFWTGEYHGLYSPWGRKESDVTFTSLLLCHYE